MVSDQKTFVASPSQHWYRPAASQHGVSTAEQQQCACSAICRLCCVTARYLTPVQPSSASSSAHPVSAVRTSDCEGHALKALLSRHTEAAVRQLRKTKS